MQEAYKVWSRQYIFGLINPSAHKRRVKTDKGVGSSHTFYVVARYRLRQRRDRYEFSIGVSCEAAGATNSCASSRPATISTAAKIELIAIPAASPVLLCTT